jgi:hypothetical protein
MGDVEQPDSPAEPDELGEELVLGSAAMESMGPIQMLSLAFPGNRF